MKKLFTALLVIIPYLFPLLTFMSFYENIERNLVINGDNFISFVIMSVIMFVLFMISFIITIVFMIFKEKLKTITFSNMLIKILYIPVHLVILILAGALGNPFLFWAIPIPLAISAGVMGVTGTIALIAAVKVYKEGEYKLSTAVLYSVLSYVYICDVVVSIIMFIKSRKKVNV